MRGLRCVSVLVAALLLPAVAFGQSSAISPESREKLEALLEAYEHRPTAEEFLALGDGVRDALIGIAQNADEAALVRGRAVTSLVYYPDDVSRRCIESLLDRPELSDIILRPAIAALAQAFAGSAVTRISPYLDDERSAVREEAARALGDIGTPTALRALRRRLDREGEDVVRGALQSAIRRIETTVTAE
jgi:HEAT repeat protein